MATVHKKTVTLTFFSLGLCTARGSEIPRCASLLEKVEKYAVQAFLLSAESVTEVKKNCIMWGGHFPVKNCH